MPGPRKQLILGPAGAETVSPGAQGEGLAIHRKHMLGGHWPGSTYPELISKGVSDRELFTTPRTILRGFLTQRL